MKNHYHQLNQFKRDRIEAMYEEGFKQKVIAQVVDCDPTTISREIKRNRRKLRFQGVNKDGPYVASIAQHKAYGPFHN